jgi:Uma2 family endonuclease
MAFPAIQERTGPHTRADLAALYALPENGDKTFELVNGEIYEVPKPKPLHNWIAAAFVELLRRFVNERGLGNVFGDNNQYDLPNGDTLVPDASYVSNETFTGIPETYHTVAPDLAIEIVSPSNEPVPMLEKVESYLSNGSKRVWVVYPETRSINVFRALDDGSIAYKTHRIGDIVTGEGVLEGFTLPVADVFPKQQPNPSIQPPVTSHE